VNDFLTLLLVGGALLCAFTYLGRLGTSPAMRAWAIAWAYLYAGGLLTVISPESKPWMAAGHFVATFFAAYLLRGAYFFTERSAPRWILPLALAFSFAEVVAIFLGGLRWGGGIAAGEISMSGLAALVVWRHSLRPEARLAERLLGPAMAGIALMNTVDGVTRASGAVSHTMVWPWLFTAFVLLMVQITALLERVRTREIALLREREERAAQLDAERRHLRALMEAVPSGILLDAPTPAATLVNRRAIADLGLVDIERWEKAPVQEIIAAATQRMTPAQRQAFQQTIDEYAETQRSAKGLEIEGLGAPGRQVVVDTRPVESPEGHLLGRVWVSHDVTDERRVAERLQHAQRMETLGTLAGGVAHDFNNQLTSILGNLQLVRDGLPSDVADLDGPLRDLEQSALHCADLTRELLEFARQSSTNPQAVAVEEPLQAVEALLRPGLTQDVRIHVVVEANLPPVLADAGQLRRVVTNLALNARDAVAERGEIRLWARPAQLHGLPAVEIGVADSGPGIPTELRHRIYDPFFTTKGPGRGTGLGLAVVYGIVEAHRAEILLESSSSAGTTFRVLWPAATGAAVTKAPAEGPLPSGDETILLAEDEPAVRRLACQALERRGFQVLEAQDGEQAVALFQAHRPDIQLALFDLCMPKQSGAEALRQIRRLQPALPAILMSGHLERTQLSDGPDDVTMLPKPFGPELLVRTVRHALDAAAATAVG